MVGFQYERTRFGSRRLSPNTSETPIRCYVTAVLQPLRHLRKGKVGAGHAPTLIVQVLD